MTPLKESIGEVSAYLQSLTAPNIFPKVQVAIERKDKNMLMKVCKKAKVPEIYLSSVVSVLLSVQPDQKWPGIF